MPPRWCAFALVVSCFASAVGAAEQFPYAGYVNADDVYLRSGPGQNYYPTEKLARGCEVEVWRHDPGGWYAVRPTEESFSWVAAEFLKPTDDGLAEVTGDRVVVRVGSTLSDVRDVIQIHLNRGEEVEVIEAKRFGNGPAAQTWYKIAAPAGEFRWVHGKFVEREAERTKAERPEPSRNRLFDDDAASSDADGDLAQADDSSPESSSDDSRQVDYTAGDDPLRRGASPKRRLPDDPDESEGAADHESRGAGEGDDASEIDAGIKAGTRSQRAAALDREIDDINLALSRMVSEEPTVWSFAELRARTEAALEQGSTAIQRGRARLLLSKMDRFEDVKLRMNQFERAVSQTERLNMMASARAQRNTTDPRFDGVGRLARVQSRRPGANVPSYALTDPSGAIRYYVTPAPGVNLQRYVGREIGVSGGTGYIPELKGRTVTAQRVMPLDDRRWR